MSPEIEGGSVVGEEEGGAGDVEGIRIYGVLWKKSSGSRWTKRFYVLKESCLFYYSEYERKEFMKRRQFNPHPRGVVPLGGCQVEAVVDNTRSFLISLSWDSSKQFNDIILDAQTEIEHLRWSEAFREAAQLTQENAKLGATMIEELESQGLRLHKEKQDYIERLQHEAEALRSQIDENEELGKLKLDLDKKVAEVHEEMQKSQTELELTKRVLEEVEVAKDTLEKDKESLILTNGRLRTLIQDMESDKTRLLENLMQQNSLKEKLMRENKNFARKVENFKYQIDEMNDQISQAGKENMALKNR